MSRIIVRVRIVSIICLIVLSLPGCGNTQTGAVAGGHASSKQTGVGDILQSGLEGRSSGSGIETEQIVQDFTSLPAYTSAAALPSEPVPSFAKNEEGVDIDLTVLSSGAVYATVYSMSIDPEKYVGTVVKMKGAFATAYDESNGIRYYACVIQDATQCCAQGIEFEMEKEGTFPDDYPDIGEECMVRGVFDTYMEGDNRYITLRNASFCEK
ncbi:MAG: hypothetical protein IKD90_00825 [Clostridiales bacterium]|nr:hypothetical protein [Clostridiales bacterium]